MPKPYQPSCNRHLGAFKLNADTILLTSNLICQHHNAKMVTFSRCDVYHGRHDGSVSPN